MMSGNYANRARNGRSRVILLLGAPGSGKGTQSALLASEFDISSISTGEILRDQARSNTPAGFRLRQKLAAGELVDDESVCDAVAARLIAFHEKNQDFGASLILDGFPRTVGQARMLDEMLDELGMPAPLVLHLDVPYDVLRRRLAKRRQCAACGAVYNLALSQAAVRSHGGPRCQFDGGALVERDDDNDGVVARRLSAYETETLPVLDYYRARSHNGGVYRRVDGNRVPGDIASEVRGIAGLADSAVAA